MEEIIGYVVEAVGRWAKAPSTVYYMNKFGERTDNITEAKIWPYETPAMQMKREYETDPVTVADASYTYTVRSVSLDAMVI